MGCCFLSRGDLPNPGIEPMSAVLAAAAAKSLQSCPTLCNPIDGSPPGSPVPGILQARKLEWVAIPSSRGSSPPGFETMFIKSPALTGGFFTTSTTWEALTYPTERLK